MKTTKYTYEVRRTDDTDFETFEERDIESAVKEFCSLKVFGFDLEDTEVEARLKGDRLFRVYRCELTFNAYYTGETAEEDPDAGMNDAELI